PGARSERRSRLAARARNDDRKARRSPALRRELPRRHRRAEARGGRMRSAGGGGASGGSRDDRTARQARPASRGRRGGSVARLQGGDRAERRADGARVLAHVADGVLLLDRSGTVRLWNPAAEGITAIRAGDIVGRAAADAIPGWQEAVDSVPIAATPDPGHPEVVIPIETERGERWIAIAGVQFFGGTVYAFRDMTDGRQLEELKASFIATASHELRTPLAAVYGAAQTLLRHDFALDEGGRDRFVSLIADESERLGRIVNEILLASQLDAGRLDLQ